MIAAMYDYLLGFLSLSWLTGPIFDKELRVSSRRRRNYVLRFTYIALLTIFLVLIWLQEISYSGSSLYRVSRMSKAGQTIVVFIVWFQFCVTQLVALTILSTSISDEIYKKTLGLLMTTPISSFQIVMGKLFSKLLQLILLMAISLPMLAIVRVLGGVPWNYLVSSLCITLTTVILVGSLSLFFSIFNRRAYVVMIMTAFTCCILFFLIPFMAGMLWRVITGNWPNEAVSKAIFIPCPYFFLIMNTQKMMVPGMGGLLAVSWPLHCIIILAASAVVLSLSMLLVRKTALRQATGQLIGSGIKSRFRKKTAHIKAEHQENAANIRHVKGPAVLWKELRAPMLGKRKVVSIIFLILSLLLLLFSYWLFDRENMLDNEEAHIMYAEIFMGLGMLLTIILPATSITSEKESRSWPLLLTTSQDDWQILYGKFVGAVRRCLPIWFVLFGHIVFFVIIGYIHPVAFFHMCIVVTWLIVFLVCSGLYFSSLFKHTTTAVIMNFTLAATIWAILPILIAIICGISNTGNFFFEAYMDTSPFVHAAVIMAATADNGQLDTYNWISSRQMDFLTSTFWLIGYMMLYGFVGLIFILRAKHHLRRNIF